MDEKSLEIESIILLRTGLRTETSVSFASKRRGSTSSSISFFSRLSITFSIHDRMFVWTCLNK